MKKLILPFLLLISPLGFAQSKDSLYKDTGEASVHVKNTQNGITYSTVETTYDVRSANIPKYENQEYLAKFRASTTTTLGVEGKERTIEFTLSPLENPSEVAFTAKQECDAIEIHSDYYKTIKYGCCASLDVIRLFDYTNGEIIEGSDKIITADIPNNYKVIYVAFSDSNQDGKTLGRITISYSSGRHYHINLTTDKPLSEETCPIIYPEITLLSSNKKDTEFDSRDNTYMLSSLEGIKSTSEINNISFKVHFACDKTIKPFIIPIINGLPFGKEQKEQSYDIRKFSSK